MLKSRVIDVLKALSPEELKQLRDFVHSPFHNKNKNVMAMFDYIKKYYPSFNDAGFTKEKIFKKIFPSKEYNDTVMRILLSDLMRITEDYLVCKQVAKSETDYTAFLLKDLMERKIEKLFLKKYKESSAASDDLKINDTFFLYRHSIEELNKGFNIDRNMQQLNSKNLVDMGNYLIIYFLIKLSSVVYDIDVNRNNFNTEFNSSSVEGFRSFINHDSIKFLIKNEEFKERDILEMFYYAFLLNYDNVPEETYTKLKELFYKNIPGLERSAVYNLFLSLINYNGKRNWKDTDNKYRKETLELYKEMLRTGYYSWNEGGFMTVIMFRSILTLCSMLRDIDWMEYFINNYIDMLEPAQRQNMFYFSKAKLDFSKRDYASSLENISKVNYNLFTFKFDVKTLMLQIYYELCYFEEAAAMVDSYRHFLSNNRNVSQSFREWNVNFLNFYVELINCKSGRKKTELDLLRKRIDSATNTASSVWLKNKAYELS